jgi:SM-20-related protein
VALAAVEGGGLRYIDLLAFERTPLIQEPFPYVIVPGFLRLEERRSVASDYPRIDQPGSFPLADLRYGPAFAGLVRELEGDEMRRAFATKFSLDLTGRPTMVTARGQAGPRDGNIHADSATKLITVLLYLNEAWEAPGGRLRLLRRPDDIESTIAEVPPSAGTLLAFRVTPNSWHGHKPADGARRVVQLNWVTSERVVRMERLRHGVSARLKRFFG